MSTPSTAKTITQVQGLAPHPPKEHDSFSFDSIHTSQDTLSSFQPSKNFRIKQTMLSSSKKERNVGVYYIGQKAVYWIIAIASISTLSPRTRPT